MAEHGLAMLMAAVTLIGILAGYRVALVLAGVAALFILATDIPLSFFKLLLSRVYANVLSNWLLIAVPMFVFMGYVLEKTGVAEKSLRAAQRALGGTPRGMCVSVMVIGLLLAASSGIVGASVVLLTLLALPRLTEAGISKSLSAGLIASSGTLAILVPPSIMLIILGDQLKVPIGDMFGGAILPGLLLVLLSTAYVFWRTRGLAKSTNRADSGSGNSRPTAHLQTLRELGPLVLLITCVLGSIISGLATPTEAAGLGAAGAILIAALYGLFDVGRLMEAARDTVVATSMIFLVLIGATCFSAVFRRVGGDDAILALIGVFGSEPWTVIFVVMAMIFLLGFVLDWLEISLILMPIFGPLVATLDFGNGLAGTDLMLWFGILVAVNLQTSFLTPPFGFSLFYLKGAAGHNLATTDIYRGVIPFIVLQLLALGILLVVPGLTTGFGNP